MKPYLAEHDRFTQWIDSLSTPSDPAEVDIRLLRLAQCAANRGMSAFHWTAVVDGLIGHVKRRWPHDTLMSAYIARGLDLAGHWDEFVAMHFVSATFGRAK